MLQSFLGLALGLLVLASPACAYELAKKPDYSKISKVVVRLLEEEHFSGRYMDNELSADFLQTYLEELDPNRLIFLQSDIDEFRNRYGDKLDDMLPEGDFRAAQDIYTVYRQRWQERIEKINDLLDREWTFDSERTVKPNRDEAEWPATYEEAEDLWARRIEGELLQLTLAEAVDEDPPAKILRERYENLFEAVEETDQWEVSAMFLSTLSHTFDPHSEFLSDSMLKNFEITMELQLEGIGAMLRDVDDYAEVIELVPGGPAARQGELRPGDRITAVAQGEREFQDTVGMDLDDVVQLIRGKSGSTVRLRVIPADAVDPSERSEIAIVRGKVELKSAAAKAELRVKEDAETGQEMRIGRIILPSFYAELSQSLGSNGKSATADVERLIKRLKKENIDGLVVDLTRNGGGSLDEAIKMTGLFVGRGPVVQVKKSRAGRRAIVTSHESTRREPLYEGPLVVLVDRSSASASEIFAAALQDYGRAVVVGDSRTFGKGTVQSMRYLESYMPFWDKEDNPGALKVTVQKYYRIAGGSTQLEGVVPDIILPSPLDHLDFGERALDNALPYDEVKKVDFNAFDRDTLYLSKLKERSAKRVASNAGFRGIIEQSEQLKEQQERNELSLNMTKRKERMEREKKELEELEDLLNELTQEDSTVYEITLDNVDESGLSASEAPESPAEETSAETEEEPDAASNSESEETEELSEDSDNESNGGGSGLAYFELIEKEAAQILIDLIQLQRQGADTAQVVD